MKEEQAREKGYSFTGDYTRSKEEIKERAVEYKKQGYKVVICDVPDNPYSRGGVGVGYSIYAEQKYFIDKEIKEIEIKLSRVEDQKQSALSEYNNKIAEIEEQKTLMEKRLRELIKSL